MSIGVEVLEPLSKRGGLIQRVYDAVHIRLREFPEVRTGFLHPLMHAVPKRLTFYFLHPALECLGMPPFVHLGLLREEAQGCSGQACLLQPRLFTPILTFPHQGGRDRAPHAQSAQIRHLFRLSLVS